MIIIFLNIFILRFIFDYIEEEMSNCDFAFLVQYVDFDKYFNDVNYTLEDFGWDRYTVNNKIYYIKEV